MDTERNVIHVAPHFLFRPVSSEDQRTCTRRALDLVRRYLEECRRDDGYHLILSDLDYLHPFLSACSEEREFLRTLVTAARLQLGGSYSQPHEMSIQGEPLIRNILYGRLFQEALLGASPDVALLLDASGRCLQLPQILAKMGFDAAVSSQDAPGVPPLCLALAPDGSELLQKREHAGYRPESLEQLLDSAVDGFADQKALGISHDLRLLGGEMTPPLEGLAGSADRLAERTPEIAISTPHLYLKEIAPEARLRRATVPLLARDLAWRHMGTSVSRADLKVANRLAENSLLNAEKWATFASLLGARYPDLPLDKAWRQVLFGQHGSAIGGTSGDIPFLDLLSGYREALELAREVEERSLSYIASRIAPGSRGRDRGGAADLVVFNPLGWPRTDICRARVSVGPAFESGFKLTDERGRDVPVQLAGRSAQGEESWVELAFIASDVPSLGYRTYHLVPAREMPAEPSPDPSAQSLIENEHFTIRADAAAGGGLTSIYDKQAKREVLNPESGPGNEVVALAERADREMPAWELCTTGQSVRSSERPAKVSVVRGPVFSQLRIEGELPDRCAVKQEVTLYRGLRRIDLRTTLEHYRGVHELLALTFPLSSKAAMATFEDRFAAVVRKPGLARLEYRTLDEKNLSRSGLGAAQNWVDAGPAPSVTIMKGSKATGEIPMGPCAIITSGDLRERTALRTLAKALLSQGITCTPWIDTQDPETDTEACAFRISLGRRNAYSQRALEAAPGAAAQLNAMLPDAEWAAVLVRRADPGGEWPDVPVLIADTNDPGGTPRLAELLAEAIESGRLSIPDSCDFSGLARPHDDCGAALINRGAAAASLESDGTLVSLLCHTAAWSSHPWGEGSLPRFLVPEHKSHVFEHALLPHAGDWRRGGVVHAGHEFSSPLRAIVAPDRDRGSSQPRSRTQSLPPTLGLISVDAPNLIITAVKPLGNPIAARLMKRCSLPQEGVMIRCYEAHGRPSAVRFSFPVEPAEAWLTDLLEQKTGDAEIARVQRRRPPVVSVAAPACGIVTVAARLARIAEPGEPLELGPTAEPYSPIYSRYWDHNQGAAPMGGQPLTLWARGPAPPGRNTRFLMGLSNNSSDREISGSVDVLAPPEWQLIPRKVPYRIAPASEAVYEVMVIVPEDVSPCFLRLIARDDDTVIQDVMPIGAVAPLDVSLQRDDSGFAVRVTNPNADFVEGQATLITPLESWGRAVDRLALSAVTPRLHAFRLEAGEEKLFSFRVDGERDALWAVAKVMWYGEVQYAQLQD